jgi:hypothetical protein
MRKTIAEKTLDLRDETMSSLGEAQVKSQDIYRQSIVTIDDELLESFRELEIHDPIQNCYGKGYGKDLTLRQLTISRQTIRTEMPLQFISMRQARSVFHVLSIRNFTGKDFQSMNGQGMQTGKPWRLCIRSV